jgi:hypothetical protein
MLRPTLLLVAGLVLAALPTRAAEEKAMPPQALQVDMDKVIQPDFLGVNAVYHGFAFMPEQVKKGMDDADRKREFDRVAAMKLNIARTWYGPDLVNGTDYTKPYDWNSEHLKGFYAWLKEMKARDVDVALSLGWWFPQNVNGSKGGGIPKYCEWISESLHQFIEVRGFTNIKYGILFTEPAYNDTYKQMALALDERLKKDGRRKLIKIVGPNQTSDGPDLGKVARDLNGVIDIYSSHNYNFGGYADWKRSAEGMMKKTAATGKPFWYDEYGRQDYGSRQGGEYGNYIAQATAAFINAGAQTSTVWLLFDQQYCVPHDKITNDDAFHDGVHRWGFCKWPRDNVDNPTFPYPGWYAFSLMSRYLGGRNGTKVYQTTGTEQVVICAVRHPDDNWSFLVVNCGKTVSIRVTLSKALDKPLYRYVYNPARIKPTEAAELIGYSRTIDKAGTGFEDSLPQKAVAIYSTIAGEQAKEEAEPKLKAGIKEARASSSDDVQSGALFTFDDNPGTVWNAGGFPPAWVEAVLEKKGAVAELSAVVSQVPEGETQHEVVATFADGTQKVVHTFEGKTKSGDVLVAKFNPPLQNVTAIRILTRKSPSWVSWFEITIK